MILGTFVSKTLRGIRLLQLWEGNMAEKRLHDAVDINNNQAMEMDEGDADDNPEKRFRAQADEDGMLLKPDDPDFNDDKTWCKVWDTIKCPICLDVCNPPIHQCQRGHNICNSCKVEVQACPLCGNRYSETRNFAVEDLINTIPLPCRYRVEGCTFKGDQQKKEEHEKTCECQPYNCPAEKCGASVSEDDIINHLVTQHNWKLLNVTNNVKDGEYEDMLTVRIPPPENGSYNCVLQILEIEQWGVFLLVASIDTNETVTWVMQTIASKSRAKNYEYEMKFCSLEEQRRKVEYAGYVSSLLSTVDSVIKEGSCLKTMAMLLRATCPPEEDGRCKMCLKIRKVA